MSASPITERRWIAYAWAVGLALATIGLGLVLARTLGDHSPLLYCTLAVALSAYLGGLGPGIVATGVGFVGSHWLFVGPRTGFGSGDAADAVQIVAFLAIGIVTSLLCEALRQARLRSESDARAQVVAEQRFRRFMENLPGAAWIKDVAGRYVYANSTAARVFGRPIDSIVGRTDAEIFPASTAASFRANDARAVASTSGLQTVELLAQPDGVHHSLVSKFPLYDDGGAEVLVAGVAIDVTDRMRVQDALREEQQRLERALTAARMVAWSVDPRADVLLQSDTALDVLGVRHEVASTSTAFIHPEDRARHVATVAAAVAARGSWTSRFRWLRPDGRIVWAEDHGQVEIGDDGEPVRYSGILIDVTARKRIEDELALREREFSTLVENSPDVVFRLDLGFVALFVNSAVHEALGIAREACLGRTLRAAGVEARACEAIEAACREAIARREPSLAEFAHARRAFRARIVPEIDDAGAVASLLGVVEDVTERKLAEEERRALLESERAARGEAERANRLKDDFVATLSHEQRTPLSAILGWTHLLRQEQPADVVAQGLEVIERNARVQSQLVSDLLDVSRIASGKIRLDVESVDLGSCVANAVESIRLAAAAKGIRLVQIGDGRVRLVRGDPARLQQVVWNLLSNAIKFTGENGTVTVRVRGGAGFAEIAVEDDGQGIAPEFLPYLFERFRQADGTTTRRSGGLGLGLSIVKQLVEMHGGDVDASSPGVGRGATFTVRLPAVAAAIGADALPSARPSSRPDHTLLAGLKVLVVDDQPDARDLMKRMLEEYGAVVATAGSAAEAVEAVTRGRPHLLLSDLGMPGEDGFDLIRKVRAAERSDGRLPAAAVSALARPEDRKRAFDAGFDQHVAKPIEPAELVEVVLRLAGQARG